MPAPAAAFQVPVSKEAPRAKRGLRAGEIADVLGLGKSRRNVTRKGGKMVRAWGGQWDERDIGQLFRRSEDFAGMFLFMVGAAHQGNIDAILRDAKKTKPGSPQPGTPTGKEVTWYQFRHATIEFVFDPKTAGTAKNTATRLALDLAQASNLARVHPYTMLAVVMGLAYSLRTEFSSGGTWWSEGGAAMRALSNATGGVFAGTQGSAGDVISLARTFKRAAARMTLASSPVFAWARKAISNVANYAGYYTGRGLRAWSGRGSRPVGVEVVEIVYEIPNRFDEDGNPEMRNDGTFVGSTRHRHRSAAIVVEERGDVSSDSLLRGMLDLTPCGRVYLCASQNGRDLFLGSDRRPARRVFLVNEFSPRDAALHNLDVNKPVSGFVF